MASWVVLLLLLFATWKSYNAFEEDFHECLAIHSNSFNQESNLIHTPNSTSFINLLQSSEQNPRWLNLTSRKPVFILTPSQDSEIKTAIFCSRMHGMQIRVKSGGHDYEGLSFLSESPFVMIDLVNFRSISISLDDETAWVQSGATLGELYYEIAKRTPKHGFPAGICPCVGVGGHFSGGGIGVITRKYGLAADNVMDAYMLDEQGITLDRKTMGEDVFWAIRGGGAASFGVVLAWKIKLVPVPEVVKVFTIVKELDQKGTEAFHKWPWEVLLNRTVQYKSSFKAKTDFVMKPIPLRALRGMYERVLKEQEVYIIMDPLGGVMDEILDSAIPFPHRKGRLYNIQYLVRWENNGLAEESEHLEWINELFGFMKPYVSHSPRRAYINYRDLDIGINQREGDTSYSQAKIWGKKNFKSSFKKLAPVKSKVDPGNFFRNEQSIPLAN